MEDAEWSWRDSSEELVVVIPVLPAMCVDGAMLGGGGGEEAEEVRAATSNRGK